VKRLEGKTQPTEEIEGIIRKEMNSLALENLYDVFQLEVEKKKVCLYYRSTTTKVKYSCCSKDYMRYISVLDERNVIPDAEFKKVAKIFILMKILPYTRSKHRAVDIVRSLSEVETLFWFSKISGIGNKAVSSFLKLYY